MGIRGFFAEAEYLYSCYTIHVLTVSTSILVFLIMLNLFFIGKTMAKSALLFLKNLFFFYIRTIMFLSLYVICIVFLFAGDQHQLSVLGASDTSFS